MSILPPSPFLTSDGSRAPSETAAASPVSSQVDVAGELSLAELERRGFDAEGFLKKIAPDIERDPSPMFLAAPSQAFLHATDLIPMLEVLAGR